MHKFFPRTAFRVLGLDFRHLYRIGSIYDLNFKNIPCLQTCIPYATQFMFKAKAHPDFNQGPEPVRASIGSLLTIAARDSLN